MCACACLFARHRLLCNWLLRTQAHFPTRVVTLVLCYCFISHWASVSVVLITSFLTSCRLGMEMYVIALLWLYNSLATGIIISCEAWYFDDERVWKVVDIFPYWLRNVFFFLSNRVYSMFGHMFLYKVLYMCQPRIIGPYDPFHADFVNDWYLLSLLTSQTT